MTVHVCMQPYIYGSWQYWLNIVTIVSSTILAYKSDAVHDMVYINSVMAPMQSF